MGEWGRICEAKSLAWLFGRCVDGGGPGQRAAEAQRRSGSWSRWARMGNFARAGREEQRRRHGSYGDTSGYRASSIGMGRAAYGARLRARHKVAPGPSAGCQARQRQRERRMHARRLQESRVVRGRWAGAGGSQPVRSWTGSGRGWRVDGRAGEWCVWPRDSVAAAVRGPWLWRPEEPLVPWLVIPGVREPERIDVEWRCRCSSRGV